LGIELSAEEALQERIRLASVEQIALRIRQAREESGLSHDRLGAKLGGVSRQHLIKLEKARHRPRAEMLTRIAEATGREIDWFLESDPSPFRDDQSGADDRPVWRKALDALEASGRTKATA
jgi:transcriptional regulator with XRE-family HTH domain